MQDTTQQAGWLPRQWARFFGKADAVGSQLKELSRQGLWFSRWAHFCAIVMLILFSLGSLVGIAGPSTAAFLAAWQHGRFDLIQAISSSVSTVLVLCMDTAALYAAMQLRLIEARESGSKAFHWVVIIAVDILEAASFIYMAWRYDVPVLAVVWLLIIARAIAAPFLAVYLSLARPIPIGAPDMLHMAGMAAGKGLITDVTLVASDPAASIARKAEIFGAASLMAPRDRSRLDGLITVLQPKAAPTIAAGMDPYLETLLSGGRPYMPPTPPDGGTPIAAGRRAPLEGGNLDPASVVAATWLENTGEVPSRSRAKASSTGKPKAKAAASKPRKRVRDSRTDAEIEAAIEAFIKPAVLAGRKAPSNTAIARGVGVSTSTASKHKRIVLASLAPQPANVTALPLAR